MEPNEWVLAGSFVTALAAHLAVIAFMLGSMRTELRAVNERLSRVERKLWNGGHHGS